MSNKGSKDRRKIRKQSALARQEVSSKLTPQQRIEKLDWLFGAGKGATKERAKLEKRVKDAEEKANKKVEEDAGSVQKL